MLYLLFIFDSDTMCPLHMRLVQAYVIAEVVMVAGLALTVCSPGRVFRVREGSNQTFT
jgi:hypothetical protein